MSRHRLQPTRLQIGVNLTERSLDTFATDFRSSRLATLSILAVGRRMLPSDSPKLSHRLRHSESTVPKQCWLSAGDMFERLDWIRAFGSRITIFPIWLWKVGHLMRSSAIACCTISPTRSRYGEQRRYARSRAHPF